MENTVLILGAGASCDYNYPLWGELKQQLIDFDFDLFFDQVGEFRDEEMKEYRKVHSEFLNLERQNSDHTLDRIAFQIDLPKEKHRHPTGYRLMTMTGFLLAQIEMKNIAQGWVSDFQKILIDHLVFSIANRDCDTNFLDNLTIISLNYDRSFEHLVSLKFYDRLIGHSDYQPTQGFGFSKTLSVRNSLRVLKPHGYICQPPSNASAEVGVQPSLTISETQAIGSRYPNNDMHVGYGDQRLLKKDIIERMGRHMYVVDERGENDYQKANRHIRGAENVFCLGLSQYGFNQSHFQFGAEQKIHVSNAANDLEGIKKVNPDLNIFPLNGSDRLDAKDFPQKFKDLAL